MLHFCGMESWTARLQQALNARKTAGLYRSLQLIPSNLIDFLSNDYLGFARVPEPQDNQPAGSGGSRLLAGNSAQAEKLENSLACWGRAARALLFTSGYMANLGVLSTLTNRHSIILYDNLAHACIKDGLRLSQAKAYSFQHNSLDQLERKLKQADGQSFVVVESVYSMDGDRAPLKEMHALCKAYGAVLIVDEAHATGLYGNAGTGLCEAEQIVGDDVIRILTFGKGMGSHGAAVLASDTVIDYLINYSRPFIYTTALPDSTLSGLQARFTELEQSDSRLLALQAIVSYFRRRWQEIQLQDFQAALPEGPIQPVQLTGGPDQAKALAAYLQQEGMAVRAVLPPTVAEGTERLRICLHAFNTTEEVDKLLQTLAAF